MENEKKYTLKEFRVIADTCYTNRWNIGKDYFEGLWAFLSVVSLMEQKNVSTVEEALQGIGMESDEYPL